MKNKYLFKFIKILFIIIIKYNICHLINNNNNNKNNINYRRSNDFY